jgi:hypothetical protein
VVTPKGRDLISGEEDEKKEKTKDEEQFEWADISVDAAF